MSDHDSDIPDCDEALANLYEYLDSEMEDAEATEIRGHLDNCSGCHSRFDFETRLRVVVRERLSEEVPPEFIVRLRAALDKETSASG